MNLISNILAKMLTKKCDFEINEESKKNSLSMNLIIKFLALI